MAVADEANLEHRVLSNGLVLVAEPMASVRSAAFSLLVPAGSAYDRETTPGAASMLCEWVMRGAGERDSRELVDALDELGVSHASGAQSVHASFSAVTLGTNLPAVLSIFADVLRRPRFVEEEIDPIRALALQGLQALEDDPGTKVIHELRRRHYPDPWGRPSSGTPEGIQATDAAVLREQHARNYRPNGTILAVAGAIDLEDLVATVERLFGDWEPIPEPTLVERRTGPARDHLYKETQQIQIATAHPTVPVVHPDYYLARAVAAILGGYSSSRLFTEVREKRGLCYSVYSSYESRRDQAAIVCHAGTSVDRAQETLDVTLGELERISSKGVDRDELDTMRASLKSSLIMQQESSMSRSASLASDHYHLGRVRSLEEISAALDALTPDAVGEFAARHVPRELTIVTLGPQPLNLPPEA
ncbi:MAG: pitrilysin family protein [Isosphaeraceae bacterium]|nr:pitrilysin family protein [Isosphaeraceae bacterium]